jgi:hypothetical protein
MNARFARLVLTIVATMACATPALADAIDGQWCSADGRHFSISGPSILTPGGKQWQGDYSRHAFRYVVPEGEAGAGSQVLMRLLSEDEVRVAEASNMPAVWHRCRAETS